MIPTFMVCSKVTMRHSMNNHIVWVIERHIMRIGSPVKALSPEMIRDLENEQLMDTAGENFTTTSSARNELTAKCDRFQKESGIVIQTLFGQYLVRGRMDGGGRGGCPSLQTIQHHQLD